MHSFILPPVKNAALVLGLTLASWLILARILLSLRRRAFIREKGCQPVLVMDNPSRFWGLDKLVGVDFSNYLHYMALAKENRFLVGRNETFKQLAPIKTYRARLLHFEYFFSNEPENLKSILATNFKHWSYPPGREHGVGQLFGRGKRKSLHHRQ